MTVSPMTKPGAVAIQIAKAIPAEATRFFTAHISNLPLRAAPLANEIRDRNETHRAKAEQDFASNCKFF